MFGLDWLFGAKVEKTVAVSPEQVKEATDTMRLLASMGIVEPYATEKKVTPAAVWNAMSYSPTASRELIMGDVCEGDKAKDYPGETPEERDVRFQRYIYGEVFAAQGSGSNATAATMAEGDPEILKHYEEKFAAYKAARAVEPGKEYSTSIPSINNITPLGVRSDPATGTSQTVTLDKLCELTSPKPEGKKFVPHMGLGMDGTGG